MAKRAREEVDRPLSWELHWGDPPRRVGSRWEWLVWELVTVLCGAQLEPRPSDGAPARPPGSEADLVTRILGRKPGMRVWDPNRGVYEPLE